VTQSVLQVLAGNSSFTSHYIVWGSAESRRLLAEANGCQLEERAVMRAIPVITGPFSVDFCACPNMSSGLRKRIK